MNRRPTVKRWIILAAVVAVLGVLARYLWQRRSERHT